jgi:hypothetical protein
MIKSSLVHEEFKEFMFKQTVEYLTQDYSEKVAVSFNKDLHALRMLQLVANPRFISNSDIEIAFLGYLSNLEDDTKMQIWEKLVPLQDYYQDIDETEKENFMLRTIIKVAQCIAPYGSQVHNQLEARRQEKITEKASSTVDRIKTIQMGLADQDFENSTQERIDTKKNERSRVGRIWNSVRMGTLDRKDEVKARFEVQKEYYERIEASLRDFESMILRPDRDWLEMAKNGRLVEEFNHIYTRVQDIQLKGSPEFSTYIVTLCEIIIEKISFDPDMFTILNPENKAVRINYWISNLDEYERRSAGENKTRLDLMQKHRLSRLHHRSKIAKLNEEMLSPQKEVIDEILLLLNGEGKSHRMLEMYFAVHPGLNEVLVRLFNKFAQVEDDKHIDLDLISRIFYYGTEWKMVDPTQQGPIDTVWKLMNSNARMAICQLILKKLPGKNKDFHKIFIRLTKDLPKNHDILITLKQIYNLNYIDSETKDKLIDLRSNLADRNGIDTKNILKRIRSKVQNRKQTQREVSLYNALGIFEVPAA